MTVTVRWEDPSAQGGVFSKKFEGVKRPIVVAPGFFVIAELAGRELMTIPLTRLVDVTYDDNTLSLVTQLAQE